MPNLTNNRLNAVIEPAVLAEIKHSLNEIREKLPFLTGLTLSERKKLNKVSAANKVFIGNTLNAANNNPGLLPSYLDVARLARDLQLFSQLDELQGILAQLHEIVDDTKVLVGNEAYTVALGCYKQFENAAKAGMPGTDEIFKSLKERFKANSPK